MTDVQSPVSRGQFLRNTAKGGLVLATSGGLLASVSGVAFAAGTTSSDISTMQAAYTAESLAVYVYGAILANFTKFSHPKLQNKDYFQKALGDEKAHKALLANALGSKTPKFTNASFQIPASVLKSGQTLLNTGVVLETAFVEAYLGAAGTFSSADLRLLAAEIAANEATHFSFFDAAAGGHGVLPAVPATATIPATVAKLKPFLTGN
ncbi:MAG TPA: ferritin-like domain-containing protein [Solirubrobacteraceae bacterium]|jgi:rubrerythrin|nr:ferritin-like domain-containing protein [Solirubrobacteraceae bacterium]